nr:deaminase domain-containing protein [Pseudomonas sp. B21-053]
MNKLQKLLPKRLRTQNARNIAYAEVITAAGAREVYVSVSGAQGLTGYLPLFQPPFPHGQVIINGTTYFNIDLNRAFTRSSLNVSPDGKLLAVPHTIKDIDTYQPALTSRPTSLDSEAKLISVIREKYPNREMIQSVNIATTMPPCNSCSVVVKEFGYDGGENALQVLWN